MAGEWVERGTGLDSVRQHNLSTVLSLVHQGGSLSRADLTRVTGLNRSTVGVIVAELVEHGLVTESEPTASNRVGRPSPVVRARPDVVAVAVNPEVDAVTVALVGLDGTVHRRERSVTEHPPTAAEAVDLVGAVLRGWRADMARLQRVVGVGVAVPGLVRQADGLVRLAPHLEWRDEPFTAALGEAVGMPAWAANDASLGANAERLFGAGRGAAHLVYINGGASGVGAGVIVRGEPLLGARGYAGELGHTLVNSAGIRCHCGAIGCLETEVAQAPLLRLLGLDSARADELTDALAAHPHSAALDAEVDRQLSYLTIALRTAVNIFNPQLIVLGGFLAALQARDPERLRRAVVADALDASGKGLRIERAELGSSLLMVGAAELAFSSLLAAPLS